MNNKDASMNEKSFCLGDSGQLYSDRTFAFPQGVIFLQNTK